MKIILQTNAIKFPLTGIGRYAYELATNLNLQLGQDNIKYFNGANFTADIEAFARTERSRSKKEKVLNFLKQVVMKTQVLTNFYYLVFPLIQSLRLKKYKDYIYHCPNYYLPNFAGKSVVTIHDLSVFSWAWCHPKRRAETLQNAIKNAIKNADILITDSEFVRQEIGSFFNYPLSKIIAVPLAAGEEFKKRTKNEVNPILANYNLEYQQYSLFVSTIEPRKNIKTLLAAYKSIPLHIRNEYPLIIIGYKGWKSEDVHVEMLKAEAEGWLKYIGYTEAEDLPFIYSGAKLFIFPSHYEGFGLPVLEAMASGVPVVCSNSSSIPEVVGDAAAMCHPDDETEFTRLISRGLSDMAWHNNATTAGLKQAEKFNWEKCAQETTKVYQQLLAPTQ